MFDWILNTPLSYVYYLQITGIASITENCIVFIQDGNNDSKNMMSNILGKGTLMQIWKSCNISVFI